MRLPFISSLLPWKLGNRSRKWWFSDDFPMFLLWFSPDPSLWTALPGRGQFHSPSAAVVTPRRLNLWADAVEETWRPSNGIWETYGKMMGKWWNFMKSNGIMFSFQWFCCCCAFVATRVVVLNMVYIPFHSIPSHPIHPSIHAFIHSFIHE